MFSLWLLKILFSKYNLVQATVLEDGLLLYVSNDAGSLHLVDTETGQTKMTRSLSSLDVSSPVSDLVVSRK